MPHRTFFDAKILVIDDEPSKVRLVTSFLGIGGYRDFRSETNAERAADAFEAYGPDLVVLDLYMTPKDGFEILAELGRLIPDGVYLPILILTGDISAKTKERALSAGAMDFLAKPFNYTETLLRIKNLLHARALYLALVAEKTLLEERVRERTAEAEQGQREVLDRLALVAEFRDDSTGDHTRRVSEIVRMTATNMNLPADQVATMVRASLLHDIGKVCIPDSILLKPGGLTPLEYERMKEHAAIGGEILKGSQMKLLLMAESIARYHHEKWDGSGYLGLEGTSIPIEARIVAVADVFDALMSSRPYKRAWPPDAVLSEMRRLSGSHFDPAVFASFLAVLPNLLEMYRYPVKSAGTLRRFVTERVPVPA